MPLFKGVEKEGSFKGMRTLFVQDAVPLSEIEAALDAGDYFQVYFGARMMKGIKHSALTSSRVDANTVIALHRSRGKHVLIMVETDSEPILYGLRRLPIQFMIPVLNKYYTVEPKLLTLAFRLRDQVQVKFTDGETILVFPLSDFHKNVLSDYSDDEWL